MIADRLDDRRDRLGTHEGGRAAAEENRIHRSSRRETGAMREFRAEGREEARFIDRRMPDMAIEIAIRAFRQTERPMDVDAEARIGTEGTHEATMPYGYTRRTP